MMHFYLALIISQVVSSQEFLFYFIYSGIPEKRKLLPLQHEAYMFFFYLYIDVVISIKDVVKTEIFLWYVQKNNHKHFQILQFQKKKTKMTLRQKCGHSTG